MYMVRFTTLQLASTIALILLALLVLWLLLIHPETERHRHREGDSRGVSKQCRMRYALLNRTMDYCNEAPDQYDRITSTEKEIDPYIANVLRTHQATNVSIFYRDLSTQRWFGVNDKEVFAPGSLMKLPLAIAYYKFADANPALLSKMLTFAPTSVSDNTSEYFVPPTTLEPKKSYSTKELIEHMLRYSDNDAAVLLFSFVDQELFGRVLADLDVRLPLSGGSGQDFLTAHSYGSIFRALYNASYLSPESSQALLDMMSTSSFTKGLVAGVPSDVRISHKFGERTVINEETGNVVTRELHDCGIVYTHSRPYLLCIMTTGDSYEALAKVISDISALVYKNQMKEESTYDRYDADVN